jgi:hypothetical protein
MTEQQTEESPHAREKLDSYAEVMRWDRTAQFRAIVYAKLLRKMVDAFGEGVLDIAEHIRRENGRYGTEISVDIVEMERKYDEDPAILINEMDDKWHAVGSGWARTCICDFQPVPEKRRHELRCVRCTYAEAFRSIGEEKIGITWCCQDMGATAALHPLFCQYMPSHMLKGDGVCYQIRELAKSVEEKDWLNSIEHIGWRSWK